MSRIHRFAPIFLALAASCSTATPDRPPTAARPAVRTPAFGNGQVAPTVKVLTSVAPSLIVQVPLQPAAIKPLYPNAAGLVTILETSDGDTLIVDVRNMPPNVKFTIFLTELAGKPFGRAEYVGDLFTRRDGTGEAVSHSIVLTAFSADNRSPGTSRDQPGDAAGVQLEHIGMWFDGVDVARAALRDPTVASTPFDGGAGPLHAGPQAMTDAQTQPVI